MKIRTFPHMKYLAAIVILLFPAVVPAQTTLSLQEALQTAAQQSVDLARADVEKKASALRYTIATESFVPTLSVNTQHNNNASLFSDDRTAYSTVGANIFWLNRYGTQLSLGANSNFAATGSAPIPLTSIDLTVSQALLADGFDTNNDLDALSREAQIQNRLFVDALNRILTSVENTYWDLVLAQYNVEITERSVDRAQQQYDDTKENISRGVLAPGDIFVVEENLVFFQQQLLRAKESQATTSARLATFLGVDPESVIVASENPLEYQPTVPPEPSVDDHPTVHARTLILEQAGVRLDREKRNRLPSIDVAGGLSLDGVDSPTSEAWAQTFAADKPSWNIGLFISMPLWFSARNAIVEDRALQVRRADIELDNQRRVLREERARIRTQLNARREIFKLSEKRFDLSKKKLETEIDKYKNGVSRLPEVVRFQRDVDSAELAVIRARVDVITLSSGLVAAFSQRHTQVGVEVE